VVNVMREVHVDFISSDVGVLGRVVTSEVLVLDKVWVVCRGQRGEGERNLQVLAGRGMIEYMGSVSRILLQSAAVG
jgi:hypothetical protein